MAKKFISFLGTNNYVTVNYVYKDKKVENVRFIQEALLRVFCEDWTEEDKAVIFLTDSAKKKNWNDNGQLRAATDEEKEGLKSRLLKLQEEGFKPKVEDVDIVEGFSEDEIWSIFDKVYSNLEEGDEVYFDVTHAFRMIPMLAMVLLNYSKFLKNIKVAGIHYGAFEKLGPAYEVKDMPAKDRNAPIVDLLGLSVLQDWTNAANNFITSGNVKGISKLVREGIMPEDKSKLKDQPLVCEINSFAKVLPEFVSMMTLCRGKKIIKGDIVKKLNKKIENIKTTSLPVFNPIFHKLKEELKTFEVSQDVKNGFTAARWCFNKGLYQQSITILQETVVSYMCEKNGLDYLCKDANEINKEYNKEVISNRDLVNSSFAVYNMDVSQWNKNCKANKELVNKIIKTELFENLKSYFSSLTELRNDINHCGTNDKAINNGDIETVFRSRLEKCIVKMESLCL